LLDLESVRSKLQTKSLGRRLTLLEQCKSTNDISKQQADIGAPHGSVVLAERQTDGRGRKGKAWLSPEGGIWLTIILRPPPAFEPLEGLPLLGALATARAVASAHGIKARVRWPNDVVFNGRKLAGTMVEASFKGNAIVYALLGLGLNANFPASLISQSAEDPVTLLDILGSAVDRGELIASLLHETEDLYDALCSGETSHALELLRQNECSRGSIVIVQLEKEKFQGTFQEYETLTRIRIAQDDGTRRHIDTGFVISATYLDS
jgi:BirA family biotin operon repressor/biotin-[acetyl-CoA-carboxylase] ligase